MALIKMIGDAHERRRGWQRLAAEQLGIDKSFVSRLLNSDRALVSEEMIGKVCTRLRLDPAFFTQDAEPKNYVTFIRGYAAVARESKGSRVYERMMLDAQHGGPSWVDLYKDARSIEAELRAKASRAETLDHIGALVLRVRHHHVNAVASEVLDLVEQGESSPALGMAFSMLIRALYWEALAQEALRKSEGALELPGIGGPYTPRP